MQLLINGTKTAVISAMRASLYYKAMIFLLVMIVCVATIGCGSGLVESISSNPAHYQPPYSLHLLLPSYNRARVFILRFSADGKIADSSLHMDFGECRIVGA